MTNKLLNGSFFLLLLSAYFLLPFSTETVQFIASLKGEFVEGVTNTRIFLLVLNRYGVPVSLNVYFLKIGFFLLQGFGIYGVYRLFRFFFSDKLSFLSSDSFFIFIAGFLFFFAVASFQTEISDFPFLVWNLFFLLKFYENHKRKYFFAWLFFFILAFFFGTALTFFALAVLNILLNFYYKNEVTESVLISTIVVFIFSLIFSVYSFEEYVLFIFPKYQLWHLLLLFPWLLMSLFAYIHVRKKTLAAYERLFKFSLIASFLSLLAYGVTAGVSFLLLFAVFTAPVLALVFYKFLYFRKNIIIAQFIFVLVCFVGAAVIYYFLADRLNLLQIAVFSMALIFPVVAFILIYVGLTYDLSIIKSTLIGSFSVFLIYIFSLHPQLEKQNPGVMSAYTLYLQKIPLQKIRFYIVPEEYENAYYLFYPRLPKEWKQANKQDLWIFTSAEGFLKINKLKNIRSLTEFQGERDGVHYTYYLIRLQ